ncbi:MAG TPA: trimethyllysine dioxygenase [Steroidobacteraceae bacterium]|jgi:trimethyllysine dioxygenase|nr:trimethyllysine dioxygenase [Steroidobacteraceae bacterium]
MLEDVKQRSPGDRARLEQAVLADGEVELRWQAGDRGSRFSPFWLRDHCHGKQSLHPDTLQRQVDTFSIPADITPSRLEIADEGRTLRITWVHDGSESVLPAAFLREVAEASGRIAAPRRRLWDRDSLGVDFPTMEHAEIISGDAGLLRWLSMLEEYGFALAAGVPPTIEATRQLVTRIGYVRQTIFGGMWDFTANLAFKDTAYTSAAIGPHTDGTYSFDPPGYQMFHCLKFDGTGGESTLVDGFAVADRIKRSDPLAFEVLSSVKVPAQYLGDGVHLRAEHPVIGLDHDGDLAQIAYNNYDRAPFSLPPPRMAAFYRALKLFNRLINDPAHEITMRLAPGTALLFDNWRTLHGRRAYRGERWLGGAYLNKEDVESKLRVLRAKMAE